MKSCSFSFFFLAFVTSDVEGRAMLLFFCVFFLLFLSPLSIFLAFVTIVKSCSFSFFFSTFGFCDQ